MNITKTNRGLEMTANYSDIRCINLLLKNKIHTIILQESIFISEFLSGDPMGDGISYEQVAPEDVGALTGAPLISDGENVYGYMNYAISNFLEELANGKTVVWQKG